MNILPRNLGSLATLASKDSSRYSMNGVRLKVDGDGYTAVATDGRVLGIVKGSGSDAAAYPALAALASAPNGECEASIPAKDWTAAFRAAPKKNKMPLLNTVAVVVGKEVSTLVSTDMATTNVAQPANVEGSYPDYAQVIPSKSPAFRIRLNPLQLAALLEVAAQYRDECGPKNLGCVLEFHASDAPMVVRASNGTQDFVGLIMPITL